MDRAADLITFVDASPSPFHAVASMAERLHESGFTALDETDTWALQPGDTRYVVRDGGSIVAFRVGTEPVAEAGFRLVGAHTDSPTFKVRPIPDVRRHGYRQVGVEPYGGVLYHTWFDRDLTLAGRVAVRKGDGTINHQLVHLPGAPLRIPSLAIHLNREVREKGLLPNPQQHLVPVWSHSDHGEPGLLEVLAEHVGVQADAVLGWDLVTADTQPAALGGAAGEWVFAPRLDNLASCHAGLLALTESSDGPATQVLVANDHEEVGSSSAEGAAGSFLGDVLDRIVAATGTDAPQDTHRAIAGSKLVSADMAHAVHPNYADRHEGTHTPRLGGGPVIKHNANQAYASDAGTVAWFSDCAAQAGETVQHFVSRADLPCGSTIGPLTATRLGLATVDIGNPLLSMHSVREQAAADDIDPLVNVLRMHFQRD